MLGRGVIKPCISAYNAPIVLAKKKDVKFRFFVNFKDINKVTIDEALSFPVIHHALKELGQAFSPFTCEMDTGKFH